MSRKRYQSLKDKKLEFLYKTTPIEKFNFRIWYNTLHTELKQPKRYSMECGSDVHCITVMPNRTVHFHNHPKIEEMVHLVTFDMLQNPDIKNSTLPICLKVLRGLRSRTPITKNGWSRTAEESYAQQLVEENLQPKDSRQAFKNCNNPVSQRQVILNNVKAEILSSLTDKIKYYGMKQEGGYKFEMKLDFCLVQSFMPSMTMELKKEQERWGAKILTMTITVSPQWLLKVWKKGKAIVNNHLVLNIIKEYANGTSLCLVAKQSHGFKINSKVAVVDFDRQAISWVNDENKKDELLDTERVPRMRRTKKQLTEAALKPLLDVCNKEEELIKEKIDDKQEDIPF